jgi:hypothetical protein
MHILQNVMPNVGFEIIISFIRNIVHRIHDGLHWLNLTICSRLRMLNGIAILLIRNATVPCHIQYNFKKRNAAPNFESLAEI